MARLGNAIYVTAMRAGICSNSIALLTEAALTTPTFGFSARLRRNELPSQHQHDAALRACARPGGRRRHGARREVPQAADAVEGGMNQVTGEQS
jgi:hypothetical protein